MTLSTIFGMNLQTGWENTAAPWLFFMVLLVGLLAGYFLLQNILSKQMIEKMINAPDYRIKEPSMQNHGREQSEKEIRKALRSTD